MTQNTVPLPEPDMRIPMDGPPRYTADQMHAHAAKVCAEKDAEIEQIEATARIRRVRNEVLEAELATLRTAAQQAIEALNEFVETEFTVGQRYTNEGQSMLDAITALTAALESKT